ncbi:D-amino acid dehydrogenase [Methylobacterium crusticola]|uniref:D-amino acid dehydrogenase n=1 Tax=Methylobacterium crusticola TaxID=1697972 RepID=A0ABQ4QRI3_9HYPH|nr:FAD-binding oxidoreductase [Methylobacterium crusticola]GJD47807.1 D-amino acid dehydrogenase [Methylobacterium crusticola]
MPTATTDVAIIGAGNIGIAVAYYLVTQHGVADVVLLDSGDPMALTSAQSGENYRNWWPHPVMTAYTDHAISLLEEVAQASGNRIHMNRRGYALVTRRERPEDLVAELYRGYGEGGADRIRLHEGGSASTYQPAITADWTTAPDGVDVLMDRALIRAHFPSLALDAGTILHIRRAGDISGQQLGQFMLEAIRAAGGRLLRAQVTAIESGPPFTLSLRDEAGSSTLRADRIVNAAGPFFSQIATMLGEDLPLSYVYQQKIAFEDRENAIPRDLPFTIDLDGQELAWTDEERELLASDPEAAILLRPLPGGVHRRPEGSESGRWIKLGWAYNTAPGDPAGEPPLDPNFPDVVLRGASRLSPALRTYLGRLPRGARHYGGYYAMTPENWPLIGPMRTPGAFMAGALSGFGTMASTATGAVCAAWMAGSELPSYASALSLERYADQALMSELRDSASKGVL